MRLIATLGATPAKFEHIYTIEGKPYKKHFSFQALQAHYAIADTDVFIIGTQKTQEVLGELIAPFCFVAVDENSMEEIFKTSVDLLKEGDIVDLTQSFRSVPFGVLLSLSFSKSLEKRPYDIFYAQTSSHDCQPSRASCHYEFVSLKRYDEITDLARSINTFIATLLVLDDVEITIDAFAHLHRQLKALSTDIFNNNFTAAAKKAKQIEEEISAELATEEFAYLHHHLYHLQNELHTIEACNHSYESEQLLSWSAYLLSKDITLQAITTLYESMVAFLDEELDIEKCNTKTNQNGKRVKADTYTRRNCLKKEMKNCYKLRRIPECETFSKKLRTIDKLRNISAHAFVSDKTNQNIPKIIDDTISFLQEYYPQRLSSKKGLDRLKSAFSNR